PATCGGSSDGWTSCRRTRPGTRPTWPSPGGRNRPASRRSRTCPRRAAGSPTSPRCAGCWRNSGSACSPRPSAPRARCRRTASSLPSAACVLSRPSPPPAARRRVVAHYGLHQVLRCSANTPKFAYAALVRGKAGTVTGEPPVRRRLVGGALRRYRENVGYALEDAARVLECDRSKISRIETGQRGIRPKELRELLTEYGVPDREQAALVAIASRGGQRGWWHPYADVLPGPYLDYVIMESAAAEIMTYEAQVVPDLLQTDDYTRAIIAAEPGYATDQQREEAVAARATRRQVILGSPAERRLTVILGEAALHQAVGGPGVMAGQISHLVRLA